MKKIGILLFMALFGSGCSDFLVEDNIILELKSVLEMHPVYEAQLLTYLKLTGKKVGLLFNFNVTILKQGIKRLAN